MALFCVPWRIALEPACNQCYRAIKEGVGKDEAASIKKRFEDAGAKVEIKQVRP